MSHSSQQAHPGQPGNTSRQSHPHLAAVLDEIRQTYPPMLTFEQAAQVAGCRPKTVQDWSHRGLLRSFTVGRGRGARLVRDPFVHFLFDHNQRGGPATDAAGRHTP